MTKFKIPDDWGQDEISKFIKSAYQNNISTLTNNKGTPLFKAIDEINNLFELSRNIEYESQKELVLANFMGRCHSAYLGAIKLATSGQLVESYMVIRGCLENALYALFIKDDPTFNEELPERLSVWINRGKDKTSKISCRNMFTAGAVKKNLCDQDDILGKKVSNLYGRTIDFGAHPNFYGHVTTSSMSTKKVSVQFLYPNSPACELCIKTTVEVGVRCLEIFNRIFKDKFNSAGITEKLDRLKLAFSCDLP